MKSDNIIVNVNLWGTCIGKLSWDMAKHCSVFQFSREYMDLPFDICPSTHPKNSPLSSSFYGNSEALYQGLPEFLADALPDRWGSSLFDQWLTDNNIKVMFSANTWENPSAHIHCMGVMGKRSSLTTSDFIEFAEDFVENPEDKIRKVFRAVEQFLPLCDKYGVDKKVAEKIKSVLDTLVAL